MKKGLLFTVLSFLIVLMVSCGPRLGTGKIVNEPRTVGSFTSLDISVAANVVINVVAGASTSFKIEGHKSIVDAIKTKVEDNVLSIYSDDDFNGSMSQIAKIEITVGSLSGLSLSGAGDIRTTGDISGADFAVSSSGAQDLLITSLNVNSLTVDISGASDVEIINGSASTASYELSGAGSLKAYGLKSKQVQANTSGVGNIKVSVSDQLTASTSGVGNIRYKGHPEVTEDVSGVGSVKDAN